VKRNEESFTGRGIKETKEGKEEWRERETSVN